MSSVLFVGSAISSGGSGAPALSVSASLLPGDNLLVLYNRATSAVGSSFTVTFGAVDLKPTELQEEINQSDIFDNALFAYVHTASLAETALVTITEDVVPDARILGVFIVRGATYSDHFLADNSAFGLKAVFGPHSTSASLWVSALGQNMTNPDTGGWTTATRVQQITSAYLSLDVAQALYNGTYSEYRPVDSQSLWAGFGFGYSSGHVLTVYDTGLMPGEGMNLEVVAPKLTDEQMQKIERGDRRFYPEV